MQSGLFRKSSVERISSPEQLQDYMRVTSPGIWLLLAAVIVLLAGLVISSALATLESSVEARAVVAEAGGSLEISLPTARKDLVKPDMTVRVAGQEGRITLVYQQEGEARAIAEMNDADAPLPEGSYDVQIVTQTLSPISFLINGTDTDE